MTKVYHVNCGTLQKGENPTVLCHCLLLEDKNGLALVDAGIGAADVLHPFERIGKELIEMSGFQFNMENTAVAQIQKLGFDTNAVKHCIVSHLDPDHIGGLADFPNLQVHVSQEEYQSFWDGHFRYRLIQLAHNPAVSTCSKSDTKWFGLEARKVTIGFSSAVLLVPLFGHTLGHCGVAIQQNDKWLFYIGDAYYLRDELFIENHPVSALAMANSMDNQLRLESLEKLKQLLKDHQGEIEMFGYHDPAEFYYKSPASD